MGIRAKQLRDGTFDSTQVGLKFSAQSIAGSKIVNGDITATQLGAQCVTKEKIATTALGNGLTGGNGTEVAVQADSTTGGNVQAVNITTYGVGLDVSAIAGTNLEADGSANLRIAAAAAGDGLTGGGASALAVGAGTGISVAADAVGLNTTNPNLSYGADTVVTFPNGVTAKGLFVTGEPQDANHVVNKTYVDSLVSGLAWAAPVQVLTMIGACTIATLNGLTPTAGDAYIATDAGTPTAGSSDTLAIGDITEFDGTSWKKIVTNASNFPPDGTRAIVSFTTALPTLPSAGYTDIGLAPSTDEGKFLTWDGTSLTPAQETPPTDGNAVLVTDSAHIALYDNLGFVFEGTVPTGTWVQFTGAGTINAGAGLTKSGSTINVGDANKGVQVNADDLEFAASEAAHTSGGLEASANSWQLKIKPDVTTANTAPVVVGANGAGVNITNLAGTNMEANGTTIRPSTSIAGAGLTGGGADAVAVGDAGKGVQVNANDLEFSASEAVHADGGLEASANSWQLKVKPDTASAGNYQPVSVGTNGVGLLVSDIAGTGLEADGSANLRIASAAAGDGLTGGGGNPLAVGAGNAISVAANTVSVDPSGLITGGAAEVNGDLLDVDGITYNNITPTTGASGSQVNPATSVNNLAAHLIGIDNALSAAGGTPAQEQIVITAGDVTDYASGDVTMDNTLSQTPTSNAAVRVFYNGILAQQGATKEYTISGQQITWLSVNGTGIGVALAEDDVMIVAYEY